MLGAWADHFVASRDLVTSALPVCRALLPPRWGTAGFLEGLHPSRFSQKSPCGSR